MDFRVPFAIFTWKQVVHSKANYSALYSLSPSLILQFHLASGASNVEIPKVEENCNIDTKPHLVVTSAVSDDNGYDDDSLSSISGWSSLFDESDDDDDMSSFTTVSELSDLTWDLFEETNSSIMNLSISEVYDDGVDNYTIARIAPRAVA